MKILRYLMTAAMLGLAAWPRTAHAATWTGADGNDWFNADNWDPVGIPGKGATVSAPAGATILLPNETAELASFTMTGGTLTFSNWTTRLRANTVAINDGTLTLPPAFTEAQMSNRVWIVCEEFTLAEGAAIDADGRGYVVEQGDGRGDDRGGAGHGGVGGGGSSTAWAVMGKVYGDAAAPTAPGSGGGAAVAALGNGGGAVRIDAMGAVTIHGVVSVRGADTTANGGGGSGGSILIQCQAFKGSATGLLDAAGGNGGSVFGGAGAGGRIAVIYDAVTQSGLVQPNPPVRFRAAPGDGGAPQSPLARPGTLFLPDASFLSADMSAVRWDNVVLVIPDFELWSLSSLTLGGKIGFSEMESIVVAGNVRLLSGGRLTLNGWPDHPVVTGAGMVLDVAGSLIIENLGELELYADPLSGVAPYVECGHLLVEAGGRVSGDWHGYAQATGAGAGSSRGGAGHGGKGGTGNGGGTYGEIFAPVLPGSGGGPATDGGGKGGGMVRIGARGKMQIDGTVSARGMVRVTVGSCGGGAGGGILLTAQSFRGKATGLLKANGGITTGSVGGAGGGGRIAVWTPFLPFAQLNAMAQNDDPPVAAEAVVPSDASGFDGTAAAPWPGFDGMVNVEPGTGGSTSDPAQPGTVFFGKLMFGALLMIR